MAAFEDEIRYIEIFESLIKKYDISLLLVWTDVLHKEKALVRAAQNREIPVLQLLHGGLQGRSHGHYESKIYADKITNMSPVSRDIFSFFGVDDDKMAVTGRLEFDNLSTGVEKKEDSLYKRYTEIEKKTIVVIVTTTVF